MAIGLSGFSSGGNPIVPDIEWVLTTSQNWSPPFKCKVLAFVIGAGGLSAKQAGTTGNNSYCTSGSGAGGCAASILTLDPAVSYTIAIGAGSSHTLGGTQSGVNGGDTTLSGSGIDTMTGQGGQAGTYSQTNGQTEALGGDGGIATNGNLFNATGGAGGDAFSWKEAGPNGNRLAGGGGSVGILGKGYDGGSATWVSGTISGGLDAAAGGAGVGGAGGTIISTRSTGSADLSAGGGGTYGPGENSSGDLFSDDTAGGVGRAGDEPLLGPEGVGGILVFAGAARNGNTASTARPGAGVGGEGQRDSSVFNAGLFAGGGGVVNTRTVAGSTFFGGGTGGHATTSTTSEGCKAGDGVVIIKLVEIIE